MRSRTLIGTAMLLSLWGCDKGISPEDSVVSTTAIRAGFGGTINYLNAPPDTAYDLRLVASPTYPVDSIVSLLIIKIISGQIEYSDSSFTISGPGSPLPYKHYLKTVPYGTFKYVALVQRYGPNYFMDWKIVSVYGYTATTPQPKEVTVPEKGFVTGIDFTVDFNNLPPQPFKP